MQHATELHRDLLLVGGGHSHALALRMLAMQPVAGLRITLVSPSSHTPYSGMLPGLVAGHYSFEETHIDLARLCQWAGARFIAARGVALDPAARRLSLDARPALEYDLLSIDIGSSPDHGGVPGAGEFATPVKPVSEFWARWREVEARIDAGEPAQSLAVVGGGAGGVELALAMAHRLAGSGTGVTLYTRAPQILDGYNSRARRAVLRAMDAAGITVHTAASVEGVEAGLLRLTGGEQCAFDQLFWCTAAAPAAWIAESGLATDDAGFLAVRDTLQSVDDDRVFGAGDIATQLNHPRAKAGVFAVRQAPVLAHNLRAASLDQPLREHRPQRRFLSLLSLGDRCATADKGVLSATGNWVWRWKDRIDRTFMARFVDLPPMAAGPPAERVPELPTAPAMNCGGCGAKVGATALVRALAALAGEYPSNCRPAVDDAAPLSLPAGAPALQSLDVLRELVPDPHLMGRIAANHAFSDLYACGAKPVAALAAVVLPFAALELQYRDIYQLLSGALVECERAGCTLTGGHSMQGADPSIGFAVTGVLIDPAAGVLGKQGAQPGDVLVLTGPLGTGVLFAGHMQLQADGRDVEAAVAAMLQGNARAAELLLQHRARACTDITGFGLLGHLLEMLGPSLGARLERDSLPLLPGVDALLQAGVRSSGHPANRAFAGDRLEAHDAGATMVDSLFDPQTSGPLLAAVPPDDARACVEALQRAGYAATPVGAVLPGERQAVVTLA